MTNISEMICAYDWSFLEEEVASLNPKQDDETSQNEGIKKKKK